MEWPDQPEYLQLFSGEGDVTVRVKFASREDSFRSMPDRQMSWQELAKIIDHETGKPFMHMYLDTYRCTIQRYEIDPVKNVLTIVVGAVDVT